MMLDLSGSYTTVYLYVYVGSGDDDVEFDPTSLDADATIDGGAGDDTIHVLRPADIDTYADYVADGGVVANTINPSIDNTINLDGGDGADTYIIDATDDSNYVINVNDSAADLPGSGLEHAEHLWRDDRLRARNSCCATRSSPSSNPTATA